MVKSPQIDVPLIYFVHGLFANVPGLFVGGAGIEQDCPHSRCVGYFLEPLLWLAPFAKKPVSITFNQCITNSDTDLRCAEKISLPKEPLPFQRFFPAAPAVVFRFISFYRVVSCRFVSWLVAAASTACARCQCRY
jgi:hypothetical protein